MWYNHTTEYYVTFKNNQYTCGHEKMLTGEKTDWVVSNPLLLKTCFNKSL